MEQNKTGKYLKYAIGEIILVVIGILIALQINNWNNKNIERSQSTEFNQRLLQEVNGNIALVTNKIESMENMINSSKRILELFNEKLNDSNLKSLDSLIYITIAGVDVKFRTGTLNEGLNTGKVSFINSDILKSKLYGLLSNIEYVGEMDETISTYNTEILQPFLYKNFNYRRMDNLYSGYDLGVTKFKNQHNELLLENEQFENLIDNYFYQSNAQKLRHTNLKNEYEEIKKLIETELQTKK